jgi:class 3 adenylate cyclase
MPQNTKPTTYKQRVAEAMALSARMARLDAIRASGGFDASVIDDFAQFLEEATDEQLYRMSPLRYAAAHKIPETVAIDLFLHAAHAGLLDFNWGVLCPLCGGFITTAGGLQALQTKLSCGLCRMPINASIDDNVEVAFTVSPSVRKIRFHDTAKLSTIRDVLTVFFSTSVSDLERKKEIIASGAVLTGLLKTGTSEIKTKLEPGRYSFGSPLEHANMEIVVSPKSETHEILIEHVDGRFIPDEITLAPGEQTLTIRNRVGKERAYGLIRDPQKLMADSFGEPGHKPVPTFTPYLGGKRLVTTQTFRDLFRSESIPSGNGLEFKNLTLLFTDLKGSTEMYRRIGDFKAYAIVREHFTLLRKIVAKSGGAVVKTIGDAIMASFADPADALNAAAQMNREIESVGMDEDLVLKIGIHTGPCIAVELNERLDYFGQTVNIAARVQNAAAAGEIVVSPEVYAAPRVRDVISESKLKAKKDAVSLKGVGDAVEIYRLA